MLGGAIGATGRFLIARWLFHPDELLPWGTFTVNVVGSLLLGILFAYAQQKMMGETLKLFLMTGVLGAFTTFSTYSVETIYLLEAGSVKLALLNAFLHNAAGFLAAWAGLWLMK